MPISYILNDNKNKLAYNHIKATEKGKDLPAIMFLGGFKSDMDGTKAIYIEQQCKKRGQEFIRFDYSGHGKSEGRFIDGTIGSWKNDAGRILKIIINKKVILIGSSMGGWIALLLSLENHESIKGVIGIAAAPDFTKEIEEQLSTQQLKIIKEKGLVEIPNEYSDEPYIFTNKLLEDGKKQSLLGKSYDISLPITLIQGKQDNSVPWHKSFQIKECFKNSEIKIVFIYDGDHRLSRTQDLEIINQEILNMSNK